MPVRANLKNFKGYFSVITIFGIWAFLIMCVFVMIFVKPNSLRWDYFLYTDQFKYLRYAFILFFIYIFRATPSILIYAILRIPYIEHKDGIIKVSVFPIVKKIIAVDNIIAVNRILGGTYLIFEKDKGGTFVFSPLSKNTPELLLNVHILKYLVEQRYKRDEMDN